jgi:hypothetical protein
VPVGDLYKKHARGAHVSRVWTHARGHTADGARARSTARRRRGWAAGGSADMGPCCPTIRETQARRARRRTNKDGKEAQMREAWTTRRNA